MRAWWWSLLVLAACGWGDERGPKAGANRAGAGARNERIREKDVHSREDVPEAAGVRTDLQAPPVVVLVVMDTVRADHTSLCGYGRPTTPFLQSVVASTAADPASYTCQTYTPGTWTLPSHASFFTGLHTTEHHVLNKGVPLDPEVETLAEIFVANGYQTAMVAANPTLTRASGLWQGFHVVNVPEIMTEEFRGAKFADRLERTLRDLDPTKPLFLVVNLFDAHDPYPDIPRGIGWVPHRPGLKVNPDREGPDGPVHRYVLGQMPPAEAKAFVEHATDTYDWGIAKADQNVERTAKLLKEQGWLEHGYRLVVTSDHGEHLGEHQLMRHDGPPWETVSRVFTVFKDTSQPAPVALPEPFAGAMIFHLLKDGRLPDPLTPAASASIAYGGDLAPEHARRDAVARWFSPSHKLMWQGAEVEAYDLLADPGEASPTAAPPGPEVDDVEAAREALLRSKAHALGRGQDPEMMKALQAIGYIN